MQKAVLITGASTGIGFAAVAKLVDAGFLPIATVRKADDENHLKKLYGSKVHVLRLDVTDLEDIEAIPEKLKTLGIENLFGLINNAGVALAAPFAHQPFEEVLQTLQINVSALLKMTQVLIPILQQPGGRIINISSVAGRGGAPFLAVYAASKHAVEGFSEALRKELMLFGIKVVIVAPGSIKTPIWQKGFETIKEKYSHTPFAESFSIFIKIAASEARHALETEAVTDDLLHALSAAKPKFRYAPIPRKFRNWYLPMLIPARIYDRLTAKVLKLQK